jgi:TRAP-type C4-dicarboxylate transport system permease small subunit
VEKNRIDRSADPAKLPAGSAKEDKSAPNGNSQRGALFRIGLGLKAITGWLASGTGHLAAVTILLLAFSIIIGIALRILRIDNYWTYDLDLFALVWLAFIGAVLTSLKEHHVTAGIALENMLGGRGRFLNLLRFVIIATFLVMFAVSGYRLASSSFITHETTIDVVEWPVWIAKAALPLGAVLWLAAEIHKLLRRLTEPGQSEKSGEPDG